MDLEEEMLTVGAAARRGNLTLIKSLLEKGCEIDVRDNRGWRATHEAANGNHVECLSFLLEKVGTDADGGIHWQSFDGKTALLVACEKGSVESVELLLREGADPNRSDVMQTYPLLAAVQAQACQARSLACVQLLLSHGANVDCTWYCGTTPLHQAVLDGQEDVTRELLASKARLDVRDECEITPVFTAAHYGKERCLKLLLETAKERGCMDCVVNMCADDGGSPLYLAAQEGHLACLKLLLENGADPNKTTQSPNALPLHAAIQFAHVKCIKLLYPVTDKSGLSKCDPSMFDMAFQRGTEITQLLIDLGADVNQPHTLHDDDEFEPKLLKYMDHHVFYGRQASPLSWLALMHYDTKHAKVLLENGAAVNPENIEEAPPLIAALNKGDIELSRLLISQGARVNVYHPEAQGNLNVVISLIFWKSLKLLLLCGAEVDSLFRRDPPILNCDREEFNNVDIACHARYCNNGHLEHNALNRIYLYDILQSARIFLSRRRCSVFDVLMLLLQFTGNVKPDPKIESLMDKNEQWQKVVDIIDEPRSLMHCCRGVVRQHMGSRALLNEELVSSLPLPTPIVDYLSYKEIRGRREDY